MFEHVKLKDRFGFTGPQPLPQIQSIGFNTREIGENPFTRNLNTVLAFEPNILLELYFFHVVAMMCT